MTESDVPALPDEVVVVDAMVDAERVRSAVPDRADAPVSEITERFLRAIVAQVPLEHIEELHLFSPLRQGTAETGIAVVAARVVRPVLMADPEPDPELELESTVVYHESAVVDLSEAPEESDATSDAVSDVSSDLTSDVTSDVLASDSAEVSPYLEDEPAPSLSALGDAGADDEINMAPVTMIERHTVYTARYRLVVKGPERGRWEADIVAEAEAPLLTVEMVVRGVQRRAGEESEILRYSASQIARALHMAVPAVDSSVA
jgi:hypothetical protein